MQYSFVFKNKMKWMEWFTLLLLFREIYNLSFLRISRKNRRQALTWPSSNNPGALEFTDDLNNRVSQPGQITLWTIGLRGWAKVNKSDFESLTRSSARFSIHVSSWAERFPILISLSSLCASSSSSDSSGSFFCLHSAE